MSVQASFTRYAPRGHVGDLARPEEPHAFDIGPCYVASGGRNPRPGDCVLWNETQNAFQVPTSDNERYQTVGVVSFDPGTIPTTPASGDPYLEWEDGEIIKVLSFGTIWLTAGQAIERYHPVLQHVASTPDYQWDPVDLSGSQTTTTLALRVRGISIQNVDPDPVSAAGDIFMARIGYGRLPYA